jgi:hypothetical protein
MLSVAHLRENVAHRVTPVLPAKSAAALDGSRDKPAEGGSPA